MENKKVEKKAPVLVPEWKATINKYGDMHLRKDMIESAKHFSGIVPGTKLRMTFEKNRIILVPA